MLAVQKRLRTNCRSLDITIVVFKKTGRWRYVQYDGSENMDGLFCFHFRERTAEVMSNYKNRDLFCTKSARHSRLWKSKQWQTFYLGQTNGFRGSVRKKLSRVLAVV